MTTRLILLLPICALLGAAGCSRTGDDAGAPGMASRLLPDLPEMPRLPLRREKPDLTRFPPPAPPEMRRQPVRGGLIPDPGERNVNCREQTNVGGRVRMVCR